MRTDVRAVVWSVGLGALLLATIAVCTAVGPVDIAPTAVLAAILNELWLPTGARLTDGAVRVFGVTLLPFGVGLQTTHPFGFHVAETTRVIVVSLRLPRIALAAIVGFALAAAGTVMQGFFRNPMADPSIVGVSSGAAVGAVTFITLGGVIPFVGAAVPFGIEGAAFVGAVAAAFLVYTIATEGGRTPVATLLLAGVAVQTFLGAVVSFLMVTSPEGTLQRAYYWLLGDLGMNAAWEPVGVAFVAVSACFLLLLPFTRDLNVLMLGEEDAHHLGIEVERTKRILLAVSSGITAAGVAVAGVIGFVGLVVPHAMRLVVGPDHRVLLPTSALAGATFLVVADTLARSTAEVLPVGIVTAAVGAPFFLFLLSRREVHAL
ncbi:vitamin B12 ABC transporter permease BtuC [Haloarchaeobius iranensis]|uniref:Iron complex transport system permease protein n=1 Tax=Haloarchaeobius iranensis TaxID=996166 RepID=A0A1G9TQS6_9EURY|nr:vitamin B12 ABC transporter permease BtuC [Haloarchaeobius iranensis]SDM50002.1 iron complex transport system permease protein [Haloarchaeobius iranensis]